MAAAAAAATAAAAAAAAAANGHSLQRIDCCCCKKLLLACLTCSWLCLFAEANGQWQRQQQQEQQQQPIALPSWATRRRHPAHSPQANCWVEGQWLFRVLSSMG